MNETIYIILLWALPILLSVLAFIGVLAVNALRAMATDLNQIKVTLGTQITKHEGLEKRVDKIEEKIYA